MASRVEVIIAGSSQEKELRFVQGPEWYMLPSELADLAKIKTALQEALGTIEALEANWPFRLPVPGRAGKG